VAVSVVQFKRDGQQSVAPDSMVAVTDTVKAPVVPPPALANLPSSRQTATVEGQSAALKTSDRAERQLMPAVNRASAMSPRMEAKLIAANLNERVIINAKTGQEMKVPANGRSYGMQLAVSAPKAEPVSEIF
jgi:hypothetical protein